MKYLRHTLFITTVLGSAEVAAAADEASGFASPIRPGTAEVVVNPTPGEKVALRQREVLAKERFIELFGIESIEAFTHLKGIDWEVLRDDRIPFDDSVKRTAILRISKFMEPFFSARFGDSNFLNLFREVNELKVLVDDVPKNRLEEHTKLYFTRLFPGAELNFYGKKGGDQLGTKVLIEQDGEGVAYYVKTHSKGSKEFKSSGAKPIDAMELLVYKVLAGFGVGCEARFFGRDESNFYIATRDAGSEGRFVEYSKVDRKNKETTIPIWGALSAVLVEDDRENECNSVDVENVIAGDPFAQSFIHQMSMLDALARLMVLTDLQTNGRNFGFIYSEAGWPTLKVIDFRLAEVTQVEEYQFTESRFGGFLRGNGFFNYLTADEAVCYALRNRPKGLRVAEALNVFKTRFVGFEEKIERAKRETIDALIAAGLSDIEMTRLVRELETQAEILKENFAMFERLLREYK